MGLPRSHLNIFAGLAMIGLLLASPLVARADETSVTSADEIQGAGSTFVAPIMARWAEDYAKASGTKIVYQGGGSGAGIKKIKAGEVDFGATDKPLSSDELAANGLLQFPIVIGGVVPVVNLPGIISGQMKFSGQLLGDIYLGKVTRWDAAEVRAQNPNVPLPPTPISVVHRSDGSGTTFNWVNFLSKTNATWKEKVGAGLSVAWPVGVGGEGNAGVAAAVTQTPGSIGYVEYSFALQKSLTHAQVQNSFGLFVIPGAESFQAAAATVRWSLYKDFSVVIGDAAGGPEAYPIAATVFVLMSKSPKDPARSSVALSFFKWALEDGDKQAADLKYVALPPTLVKRVEDYWASEMKSWDASSMN